MAKTKKNKKESKYYFINNHVYEQKDSNWVELYISKKEYQKLISNLK